MSNDTSRATARRYAAVEEAFRKIWGTNQDSDAIWDALYDLYEAGFADGQQHEYSYPS